MPSPSSAGPPSDSRRRPPPPSSSTSPSTRRPAPGSAAPRDHGPLRHRRRLARSAAPPRRRHRPRSARRAPGGAAPHPPRHAAIPPSSSSGHGTRTPRRPSPPDSPAQLEAEPLAHDLAPVIHAVCAAIADGELHAGEAISVRRVARRSGVSPGRVADALARLGDRSAHRQAGRPLPAACADAARRRRDLHGARAARHGDHPSVGVDGHRAATDPRRAPGGARPLPRARAHRRCLLDRPGPAGRAGESRRHAAHRLDVRPTHPPAAPVPRDLRPRATATRPTRS